MDSTLCVQSSVQSSVLIHKLSERIKKLEEILAKKNDNEKRMLDKISSLEKRMESIRLESVRNHEELAPKVSRIGEQYRVETTKIKNFETETESITANCKRLEERVTQMHSLIKGVQKSISRINDKINDKINSREQNQTPVAVSRVRTPMTR